MPLRALPDLAHAGRADLPHRQRELPTGPGRALRDLRGAVVRAVHPGAMIDRAGRRLGIAIALLLAATMAIPPGMASPDRAPGIAPAGPSRPTPHGSDPALGAARNPQIAGNGIGRILVTNQDPAAAPNTGLLVNLTGFRL